ncbi:short-chain dehydrogenase [Rhodovulum sulfidophilum]|uniref:SDR family oxidoreductase n=1 Tax=Rhodovulum visakhapatnamense TaxID=364297 RepID=A0ABS1RC53_9RHOB|nr:SDR family oxidoreductase [Rhodovulum visakhapatnamense]MBL3568700.1 SDR family oxidoreductase [Rhodovulum visakhapatnamense]MBL3577221.1 SDR family oxidoreductase [Rhodovulum visakhapatnamense]OLS45776.1 short-chain dehydrogenase [Rhodovulum sulfidophilum]
MTARTILITGASSGIGRATAELFLDHGWRVGLLARRADLLDQIAAGHEGALPLPADVTDAREVDAAFDAFMAWAGRLDVLFNNAGTFGPSGSIDDIDPAAWAQVLAVNVGGMFLAARAAFARMRAQDPQGGRIVNNGSLSAHVPREGSVCYTTTKHAVTGLTKTLSLDGRPFGIACGQIDIGNARTALVEDLTDRARAEGRPVQPTMDVAHAARSVLHMADLPPEANVQFMTVMATTMPYIGRG